MHLPNGSQIFVAKTIDKSEKEIKKVTNATDPVFTMAEGHGLTKGDYVMITNLTWGKLINYQLRVKTVESNNVTMEGIDTSDTNQFPEISVDTQTVGQLVKVESWVELPCVQELSQDGGEQQFYTYQCLSDDREQQLPTFKSALNITYTFAHEYDNPIYTVLRGYDESGVVVPLRMYVPRASEMRLYTAVLSFNDIPQTTMNEMETVSLSASIKGRFLSISA